jgi:methyltransferase
LIVAGEIAVLPLVFGEVAVCLVFSVLNAALLLWRIRQEDAALSLRRTGDTGITSMG